MKQYLADFFDRYEYPEDAKVSLLQSYDSVADNADFSKLLDAFYVGDELTAETIETKLDEITPIVGLHPYIVKNLYYICLTKALKEQYKKAGIPNEIYDDSVLDLKYKMTKCKNIHGVWGTFVSTWSYFFFRMELFGLGRMQFRLLPYEGKETVIVGGRTLSPGDLVIDSHIPASGKPFDKTARMASYERAAQFFQKKTGDTPIFACHSWLLYPPLRDVLNDKSNIISFMDDFKIAEYEPFTGSEDLWRIFGSDADKPASELPRNTSIQRAMADWLEKGNRLGAGMGVFVYDSETKTILK